MTYLWQTTLANPSRRAPAPAPEDVNYYVNFVLYAVLGRTSAADSLMQQYGSAIERVAASLRRKKPMPSGTLYRGILLEAPVPTVAPDPQLTFISWTEKLPVACWFADPKSLMSQYAVQLKPKLEGYIITEPKTPADVLFYYKWAKDFEIAGRRLDSLSRLAIIHPDMGHEGYSQIEWALRTQFEVITKNINRSMHVQPKSQYECPSTGELDRALTWPGVYQ